MKKVLEKVLEIDPRKGLSPWELEHPYEHPIVMAAASETLANPELVEEGAEVAEVLLETLTGFSMAASIMGLLDALGIVIGNVEHDAERSAKRKAFKLIRMEGAR